jgi:hypothetical protein
MFLSVAWPALSLWAVRLATCPCCYLRVALLPSALCSKHTNSCGQLFGSVRERKEEVQLLQRPGTNSYLNGVRVRLVAALLRLEGAGVDQQQLSELVVGRRNGGGTRSAYTGGSTELPGRACV